MLMGRVGPVAARSTEDQEVPFSNRTLAFREFFWTQEMNLRGSTRPMCKLVLAEGGR